MTKETEMQLTTVLRIFKEHARQEFIGVYLNELENGNLSIPETIFAIQKLIAYCEQNSGWDQEKIELEEIVSSIEAQEFEKAQTAKQNAPINRFWVSFREWFYNELPATGLLYSQYVEYDNWNNGTYYLNIDYDSIFRLYLGITYDNRYSDPDHCKLSDIKLLIELLYKELIKVEARYEFTVQINKMLGRFSLPYELKGGRLAKKGYKTSDKNYPIVNFQMFESKIQWSEDKILGSEGLDKHTALNYITDALQYLLSLINALNNSELESKNIKQRCALLANNDENSKVYSVIQKEVSEIQTIVNEYFDIRHNEYLSQTSKKEREPLKDPHFIEYLYNRIYSLLYYIKIKYLIAR